MKHLTKMIAVSLIALAFVTIPFIDCAADDSSAQPETTNNLVANEIKFLKKFDPVVRHRCKELQSGTVKGYLHDIDRWRIVDDEEGTLKALERLAFFKLFPGPFRLSSNIVMLSPEQAPVLHTMLDELSEDLKMPKPPVFLHTDPEYRGIAASSLRTRTASLIIGERLAEELTTEEFRAILAHELAHIKLAHTPKRAAAFGGLILVIPLLPFVFPYYCRQQEYAADDLALTTRIKRPALASTLRKMHRWRHSNIEHCHIAHESVEKRIGKKHRILTAYLNGRLWLSELGTNFSDMLERFTPRILALHPHEEDRIARIFSYRG